MIAPNGLGRAIVDAARNLLLAGALVVVGPAGAGLDRAPTRRSALEASTPRAPRPPRAGAPGWTLVELLAVVAIIAILLGIALPMLAGERRSSLLGRSLAAHQQLVSAFAAYGHDHRDDFPHFKPLAGLDAPVQARHGPIQSGYFLAHMSRWLAAFDTGDDALITLAAWPPLSTRDLTDDERSPNAISPVYLLTAAVAADPAAFDDPAAADSARVVPLLRGVRWSEMTQPARKGLFIDFAFIRGEETDRNLAAIGDGSAADITGTPPPLPVIETLPTGVRWTVVCTRHGIRGADR